jgi:hypothetical protein
VQAVQIACPLLGHTDGGDFMLLPPGFFIEVPFKNTAIVFSEASIQNTQTKPPSS